MFENPRLFKLEMDSSGIRPTTGLVSEVGKKHVQTKSSPLMLSDIKSFFKTRSLKSPVSPVWDLVIILQHTIRVNL